MTVYVKGENTRQASPGDHIVLTGVFLPQMKSGMKQMFAGLLSDVYIQAHVSRVWLPPFFNVESICKEIFLIQYIYV